MFALQLMCERINKMYGRRHTTCACSIHSFSYLIWRRKREHVYTCNEILSIPLIMLTFSIWLDWSFQGVGWKNRQHWELGSGCGCFIPYIHLWYIIEITTWTTLHSTLFLGNVQMANTRMIEIDLTLFKHQTSLSSSSFTILVHCQHFDMEKLQKNHIHCRQKS